MFLPWFEPFVAIGDQLSIEYLRLADYLTMPVGHMLVRSSGGEVLFWIGQEHQTQALAPPQPFTVSDDEDLCVSKGGCGELSWGGFVIGDGSRSLSLSYGDRMDLGNYVVMHLQNVHAGTGPVSCSDWYPDNSSVAILRGTIAELDARDRGPCGDTVCAAGEYCEVSPVDDCDRRSVEASCVTAPLSCPENCPGVCGCDGRFYCNECWAYGAGHDVAEHDESCRADGCEDMGAGAGEEGECLATWSCFGLNYEIDCILRGAGSACECSVDGRMVHSFERPAPVRCLSVEAAYACGFPDFGYQR